MYRIVEKKILNPTVVQLQIEAPLVANKAKPGQFIILRVDEQGERIPLTVAGTNKEAGTVKIIFQIVGGTTEKLSHKEEGDYIEDFVGPLGNPTDLSQYKNILLVGGGIGSAVIYPQAKQLAKAGKKFEIILGARNKDLFFYLDEFRSLAQTHIVTDDGSLGDKGFVTDKIAQLFDSGKKFDVIFSVGPLGMMKFVSKMAEKYQAKSIVSMNSLMVDGTGMCGGCRLTLGGKMKFACVDGPEFDGHEIDFDEAMSRSRTYAEFEAREREEACNLFKKEVK